MVTPTPLVISARGRITAGPTRDDAVEGVVLLLIATTICRLPEHYDRSIFAGKFQVGPERTATPSACSILVRSSSWPRRLTQAKLSEFSSRSIANSSSSVANLSAGSHSDQNSSSNSASSETPSLFIIEVRNVGRVVVVAERVVAGLAVQRVVDRQATE